MHRRGATRGRRRRLDIHVVMQEPASRIHPLLRRPEPDADLALRRGQTDYLVHQVRNDPDRLQITGVTHDHGPSFLATFRPERQIAYSYPNKSQQTDACR